MKKFIFPAIAFIHYWLKKEDLYSQQSSHIHAIYSGLLQYLKSQPDGDSEIEQVRNKLLSDTRIIEVNDLGAGSKKVSDPKRQVGKITRHSTSSAKYGVLYQYFCALTPATYVLELGTCMGIGTRYLAKVTQGNLWTIEGAAEIQRIAKESPLPGNVEFISGDIHSLLPDLLADLPQLDFALIDANHTLEGTLFAFQQCLKKIHSKSILAIGDIHWSEEMEKAWDQIKHSPSVALTMDFYECGIVFFEYSGPKSHLTLAV